MKTPIHLLIALLAITTLSACGAINKPNIPQEPSQKQEKTATTTTETTNDLTADDRPEFLPRYSEFHMGNLGVKEIINLPTISNKIENVYVKAYKISKENFEILLKQHPGLANHEGKLDISKLSAKEKKPFFEGQIKINETGARSEDPHGNNSYIAIPVTKNENSEGYYYFEFKSPEVLKYTGGDEFNSLLEITETKESVSYEEQYLKNN